METSSLTLGSRPLRGKSGVVGMATINDDLGAAGAGTARA